MCGYMFWSVILAELLFVSTFLPNDRCCMQRSEHSLQRLHSSYANDAQLYTQTHAHVYIFCSTHFLAHKLILATHAYTYIRAATRLHTLFNIHASLRIVKALEHFRLKSNVASCPVALLPYYRVPTICATTSNNSTHLSGNNIDKRVRWQTYKAQQFVCAACGLGGGCGGGGGTDGGGVGVS